MKKNQSLRFKMHDHLLEFNRDTLQWTWSKWETIKDYEGTERVIRRKGSLKFMKMFPQVFSTNKYSSHKHTINQSNMESQLEKTGIDFIFLYQGDTQEERKFQNVEEAEAFYQLDTYPQWDLTGYWFGFDHHLKSWAMYDTYTGEIKFTPQNALKKMSSSNHAPKSQYLKNSSSEFEKISISTH